MRILITGSTSGIGAATVKLLKLQYHEVIELNRSKLDLSDVQNVQEYQLPEVDCLINVVDINQLSRQLVLTSQLLELGIPMIVVLNKIDRQEAPTIDATQLSYELGCPVCIANHYQTVQSLFGKAYQYLRNLSNPNEQGHDN